MAFFKKSSKKYEPGSPDAKDANLQAMVTSYLMMTGRLFGHRCIFQAQDLCPQRNQ